MAGLGNGLGAFGQRQHHTRQGTLDIAAAGSTAPGTAPAQRAGSVPFDLPDAGGRPLAQARRQAPPQVGAAQLGVGQQPVTRGELAVDGGECCQAGLRRVAVDIIAFQYDQPINAGFIKTCMVRRAEEHRHHGPRPFAIGVGQLPGQAQQVAVVAGEAPAGQVRYHRDQEVRGLDDDLPPIIGGLAAGTGATSHHGSLLDTAAVDALDAVGPDEADRMGILADHAVGAHPLRRCGRSLAKRRQHAQVLGMQAVAGDPLAARIATHDLVHGETSFITGRASATVGALRFASRRGSLCVTRASATSSAMSRTSAVASTTPRAWRCTVGSLPPPARRQSP